MKAVLSRLTGEKKASDDLDRVVERILRLRNVSAVTTVSTSGRTVLDVILDRWSSRAARRICSLASPTPITLRISGDPQ